MDVPREKSGNMLIENILPIYSKAPDDSPVRHATNAVAANMFEMWQLRGPDTQFARRMYFRALNSLSNGLTEPDLGSNTDYILTSIFMLDFYEQLTHRIQKQANGDMHLKAALTLMKDKGKAGFSSEASSKIFTALRSRYILFNLEAGKRVEIENEFLRLNEHDGSPNSKIHLLMAKVANLVYDNRLILHPDQYVKTSKQWPAFFSAFNALNFDAILQECLLLNAALDEWNSELPASWRPYRSVSPESIHHSIRAVGLYNGLCDVYASIAIAQTHNSWRSLKIMVLSLVRHCLTYLPPSPRDEGFVTVGDADEQIQEIVDDVCASVPYHLGSRTNITQPHERAEYPPVPIALHEAATYCDSDGRPTVMTEQDHIRSAAATGGWNLVGNLGLILRYSRPRRPEPVVDHALGHGMQSPINEGLEPLNLRKGQVQWMFGQVKRICKVYTIPFGDPLPVLDGQGSPE